MDWTIVNQRKSKFICGLFYEYSCITLQKFARFDVCGGNEDWYESWDSFAFQEVESSDATKMKNSKEISWKFYDSRDFQLLQRVMTNSTTSFEEYNQPGPNKARTLHIDRSFAPASCERRCSQSGQAFEVAILRSSLRPSPELDFTSIAKVESPRHYVPSWAGSCGHDALCS